MKKSIIWVLVVGVVFLAALLFVKNAFSQLLKADTGASPLSSDTLPLPPQVLDSRYPQSIDWVLEQRQIVPFHLFQTPDVNLTGVYQNKMIMLKWTAIDYSKNGFADGYGVFMRDSIDAASGDNAFRPFAHLKFSKNHYSTYNLPRMPAGTYEWYVALYKKDSNTTTYGVPSNIVSVEVPLSADTSRVPPDDEAEIFPTGIESFRFSGNYDSRFAQSYPLPDVEGNVAVTSKGMRLSWADNGAYLPANYAEFGPVKYFYVYRISTKDIPLSMKPIAKRKPSSDGEYVFVDRKAPKTNTTYYYKIIGVNKKGIPIKTSKFIPIEFYNESL